MNIKPGDKVTLAQDEEIPENWYLFKDQHGFAVRIGYDKKSVLFNHRRLRKTFLDAIGKDSSITNSFLLAGHPTVMKGDKIQYWGVLIG